jgi:predicted ferric reductase
VYLIALLGLFFRALQCSQLAHFVQDSPIHSLLESGFDAHKRRDVRLYYGARNLDRMAYQVQTNKQTEKACTQNNHSLDYNDDLPTKQDPRKCVDDKILGLTITI